MGSKRALTLKYFPCRKNSRFTLGEHLRVLPEKQHGTISQGRLGKSSFCNGIKQKETDYFVNQDTVVRKRGYKSSI